MTNVEVKPLPGAARPAAEPAERACDKRGSESFRRVCQQVEQFPRRAAVQYPAQAGVLNHGLCQAGEMLEVSKANAIDAGRPPAIPPTPDEPGYVE